METFPEYDSRWSLPSCAIAVRNLLNDLIFGALQNTKSVFELRGKRGECN